MRNPFHVKSVLSALASAVLISSLHAANYIWPLSGSTTPDPMNTSFGPRLNYSAWDMHPGMDLPAPLGTSIYNCRAGTVYEAGPAGTDGYDNRHVVVQTADPVDGTLFLIYMHLNSIDPAITIGSAVAQGQVVGTVGMDGATYTHCHFEIRLGCAGHINCVHPLHYLPYSNTFNFTAPVLDRFNHKAGGMAARLLFGAPDKNEGDLIRTEVDLRQGSSLLSTRVVDLNDRNTIPVPLPGATTGDQYAFTNDIGVEGYQTSDMVLAGRTDLKEGILVRNLPPACDNLVARVIDMGGNVSISASIPVSSQVAVNELLDFESGVLPPPGWSTLTSASGTGTSVTVSAAAAYAGAQGLLCLDNSTTEGGPQDAAVSYALPSGRFEWLAEAWIDPVSLGLASGQDLYPLAFYNGTNLSVAARIRNTGTSLVAGLAAKKPDGTLTGISSSVVVSTGAWHKWTLTVLRVATRETTAVLYLDGVEATRMDWDSTVYEPLSFRAGIAYSSTGATGQVYADDVRLYEDADEVLAPVGTAAPTPCYSPGFSVTPTPTQTASTTPTATSSWTASPSVTQTDTPVPPGSSATDTPSITQTLTDSATSTATSTDTPTDTATSTGTATGTSTSTPTVTQTPTISTTFTQSETFTLSPTFTDSPSMTDTFTQSPTFSVTSTFSTSPTPTDSATASPTSSPSATDSPSFTPTATPSDAATQTSSATLTATWTATPIFTGSMTPTATPSSSGTPGPAVQPVSGNQPLVLMELKALPNPVRPGNAWLMVNLQGNAESFGMSVYTVAFHLIQRKEIPLSAGPGWSGIPFDAGAWPQGVYYVRLKAVGSGVESAKVAKILVLR
jgi:hypothetical protein